MKQQIVTLLEQALDQLIHQQIISERPEIQLERTKSQEHGDFATNLAMMGARFAGCSPRALAARLIEVLPENEYIARIEIAGPGFINFFLANTAQTDVVNAILEKTVRFGHGESLSGKRYHVEFVSANPTGPLHVGHGRWAAMGDTVSNLLKAMGATVHREYYLNDAGRQMDILATSVWLRYLMCCGVEIMFPLNGYHGGYIQTIAEQLLEHYGRQWVCENTVFAALDEETEETKEAHIDALIECAQAFLGDQFETIRAHAKEVVLQDIKEDLSAFGVHFDTWFSEKALLDTDAVEHALLRLKAADMIYVKDGATWLKTTHYQDDKDRVLIRSNGQNTYFMPDIAYHMDKLARGYTHVIDLLGADHHGYIARLRAAMLALGAKEDQFKALVGQFVHLYQQGEPVQMSTRSGEFVTLRTLRDSVGNDAARFFYVMRKFEQTLDFDMDLAQSQSQDNPVYYIQYAHARICSVFRQCEQQGRRFDQVRGLASLAQLSSEHEQALLRFLAAYPERLEQAACGHEPHVLAQYLRQLATHFHTYYNSTPFLVEDEACCQARLCLILSVKHVLVGGLTLIGVSAPETM